MEGGPGGGRAPTLGPHPLYIIKPVSLQESGIKALLGFARGVTFTQRKHLPAGDCNTADGVQNASAMAIPLRLKARSPWLCGQYIVLP
jgi:hypothetical protein